MKYPGYVSKISLRKLLAEILLTIPVKMVIISHKGWDETHRLRQEFTIPIRSRRLINAPKGCFEISWRDLFLLGSDNRVIYAHI